MATRDRYEEAIRLYVETSGDKELGALAAQLAKLGDGSSAAATKAQALVDELDKLAATGNNIREFTALKGAITETGTSLAKAKEDLASLGAEFDRTDKPTVKLQNSLKRAAQEVENLSKQQNRQQVELQKTAGALRVAGVNTNHLGTAYDKLQSEFGDFAKRANTASDAMQRTGRDGQAAASGVNALSRASTASSKSLALIALKLTSVSSAAVLAVKSLATISGAAFLGGAVKSATELEEALSQVQAVTGASADELGRLKVAAEEAGTNTKFSTLQATQALGELARATGDADAAIKALPATLNLAAAAGIEVADASNIVTTTLAQFGLSFDQATRVADLFQTEANATSDTVSNLGLAMSYTAPLAAQLGMSIEQTTVVLGALAQAGFRGERAGTALRNVFGEILNPASKFTKAVRELGIESTDFATIMDELAKKGRRGRDAILQLDAAASPAILSLAGNGNKYLGQLKTAFDSASGSAERAANTMRQNLSGAAEAITDSFDRTRRSLVEPLLEPLQTELFDLANQLEEFSQSPEFEELKTTLKEIFLEAADAARELVSNIDFQQLAEKIKAALEDSGDSINAFKENIGTITDTVLLVGDTCTVVFNALQTSILLIAASVSKIISVLTSLANSLPNPTERLARLIGLIPDTTKQLDDFAAGMDGVATEFGGRFSKNLDELSESIQAFDKHSSSSADSVAKVGTAAGETSKSVTTLATVVVTATDALQGQAAAADKSASSTTKAAADLERGADRIRQAFADMGITSQEELSRAAVAAKNNFELIRRAVGEGQAAAEDSRRAFEKYAQAARAAVEDSDIATQLRVEGELSVLEASLRVTGSFKDMGRAGRNAGREIAEGSRGASRALDDVARANRDAGDSAEGAASKLITVGDSSKTVAVDTKAAAQETSGMSIQLNGLSDNLVKAYFAMNQYAGSPFWSLGITRLTLQYRAQVQEVENLTRALDAQTAALDPINARVEGLRKQYNLLNDDQLKGLAEKQQRVQDDIDRQTEQLRTQREEADKAATAARVAAQQADANTALAQPINDTISVEFVPPSKSVATSASAAELEQAERLASLVAPLVLQRIERSRSVSIRRRTRG